VLYDPDIVLVVVVEAVVIEVVCRTLELIEVGSAVVVVVIVVVFWGTLITLKAKAAPAPIRTSTTMVPIAILCCTQYPLCLWLTAATIATARTAAIVAATAISAQLYPATPFPPTTLCPIWPELLALWVLVELEPWQAGYPVRPHPEVLPTPVPP
jgi:hypothetical protein